MFKNKIDRRLFINKNLKTSDGSQKSIYTYNRSSKNKFLIVTF